MKTCSRCRESKSESEFYSSTQTKDGLHPACAECERRRKRQVNPQLGPYRATPIKAKYLSVKVNGVKMQLHRYLMEQHLGRKLGADEDVHHINGNKRDNRIENLQVMSHSEHSSLENKGRIKRRGYKLSLATRLKMSASLIGNQRGRKNK